MWAILGLDEGVGTGLDRMLIRRGQGRSQLHEPVIAGEIALPAPSPLHAGEVTKSSRLAKNVKSAKFVVRFGIGLHQK